MPKFFHLLIPVTYLLIVLGRSIHYFLHGGFTMKAFPSEILHGQTTALAVATGSGALGLGTIFNWVPLLLGCIATFCGIILSCVLIFVHLRKSFLDTAEQKLAIKEKALEVALLEKAANKRR